MSKTSEQSTEKKTGIICPNCKEFIPEPIQNTLKVKVTWYPKGKDPKKGAKPIKITRYVKAPSIGATIQFKDSLYRVEDLKDQGAGEAYGFLTVVKQGSYRAQKTQIQDKTEVIEKVRKD